MIRIHYLGNGNVLRDDLSPEAIPAALSTPGGMLWVDFVAEPPETCEPVLLNSFSFHPLAVDDALHESHVPKVDDWDDYLYIVLHAVAFQPSIGEIETFELDVFLGENYIVTHHDLPIQSLDRVWESCGRDERSCKKGPDHILYRITDELTAGYMQAIDDMDDAIEQLEDEVFQKPHPSIAQRIFTLKRATLHLRRVMSPLREVLNKLARDDYAMIDPRDQVYFRDVYDHLVRLHDISESLRDLVGGALDTYLSVVNNRMNEIMKTLTIITTLFMPLSFLVGFFGMNFFLPRQPVYAFMEIPVFILTLVFLLITPAIMFGWIRRRGWM